MTCKLTLQMLEKTFVKSTFNPDIALIFSPELRSEIGDRYTHLSEGVLYVHFEDALDRCLHSGPIFHLMIQEIQADLNLVKTINEVRMGFAGDWWRVLVSDAI